MGKQKSPGDALSLQWYYKQFEMGKQKSPGGLPLGLFCFPKIIQTINDLIFISRWVINIKTENDYLNTFSRFDTKFHLQAHCSVVYCAWHVVVAPYDSSRTHVKKAM